LARWSLDRLSAYLAQRDLVISPIHLWRLLAVAGLAFQRTRSWKASPDPDYEARAARVLELYEAAPFDGPVISFDQMGPISLKPIHGAGWARRTRPERLRATYNRKHGIRYIFGALDVHRDRLYARMRPRRAGSDVLGYMRTIRLVYPARQKLYWIQDNLSANWTPDIRQFATAKQDRAGPHPHIRQLPQPDREPLPPHPRIRLQQHRLHRLGGRPARTRRLHHQPQRPRP